MKINRSFEILFACLVLALASCSSLPIRGSGGTEPLEVLAMQAPFDPSARKPKAIPADVITILKEDKEKGNTDHVPFLVEYGLRTHWNCLKQTGLARELPVESNMMLAELVRMTNIPKYTTAHEAGWLNRQFHLDLDKPAFHRSGWSSYQIYIWVKENFPTISGYPNSRRIGNLLKRIDQSGRSAVGGSGVCHYGCI